MIAKKDSILRLLKIQKKLQEFFRTLCGRDGMQRARTPFLRHPIEKCILLFSLQIVFGSYLPPIVSSFSAMLLLKTPKFLAILFRLF